MSRHHKFVVGFIIYKPENIFLERLKKTVADGFKIYIFDNFPEESNVKDFCLGRTEIKYLTVGKNVGLGLGMSSICAQAYYEGNSALIFFDQDTVFQPETLSFIESYTINHEKLDATYSAVVFSASSSGIAVGNVGISHLTHKRTEVCCLRQLHSWLVLVPDRPRVIPPA